MTQKEHGKLHHCMLKVEAKIIFILLHSQMESLGVLRKAGIQDILKKD